MKSLTHFLIAIGFIVNFISCYPLHFDDNEYMKRDLYDTSDLDTELEYKRNGIDPLNNVITYTDKELKPISVGDQGSNQIQSENVLIAPLYQQPNRYSKRYTDVEEEFLSGFNKDDNLPEELNYRRI